MTASGGAPRGDRNRSDRSGGDSNGGDRNGGDRNGGDGNGDDTGRAIARAPGDRRATRRRLLILALIGIAPVIASYSLYWLQPRSRHVNYGTLLATPAPDLHGRRLDGQPFSLASLRRQWLLVVVSPGECSPACASALYAGRQSRLMQNADQDRIERVWLLTDDSPPAPAILAAQPDLVVARIAKSEVEALPARADAIYLVDPHGNLVLAWPTRPDIKAMAKDLSRLLRASQIG